MHLSELSVWRCSSGSGGLRHRRLEWRVMEEVTRHRRLEWRVMEEVTWFRTRLRRLEWRVLELVELM